MPNDYTLLLQPRPRMTRAANDQRFTPKLRAYRATYRLMGRQGGTINVLAPSMQGCVHIVAQAFQAQFSGATVRTLL